MKNLKIASVSVLILLVYSCNNKKQEHELDIEVINANASEVVENLDISSLIDSTCYNLVQLETTEDCLIGEVNGLDIKSGRIFILDNIAKSVFIFDLSGKFLNKISKFGQGPGEYVNLSAMAVTEHSIIITDHFSRKQIEYSYGGELVAERRVFEKVWANDIFFFNDTLYYLNEYSNTASGKFHLFTISSSDEVNKYLPFDVEPRSLGISGPTYSVTKENASMIFAGNDTIYTVNNKGEGSARYLVKYDRDKAVYRDDDVVSVFKTNPKDRVLGVQKIFESTNHIFLRIGMVDPNLDYWTLYNKQTREAISYHYIINTCFNGEGGLPSFLVDNQIVRVFEAPLLKAREEAQRRKDILNPGFEADLSKLMNSIDEADNPALFIFKMKNDDDW